MLRTLITLAALSLANVAASAQLEWLRYDPSARQTQPPEQSPQYIEVMAAADDAFERLHLWADPLPAIVIADMGAPGLNGRRASFAYRGFRARTIYVNRDSMMAEPWHTARAVEHAIAHLATAEHHGWGVDPHGEEFKAMCADAGYVDACEMWSCSFSRGRFPVYPQSIR
ncbi:MAG: hypothetical protein AAGB16_06845 [Pseudomonadota bacterium]